MDEQQRNLAGKIFRTLMPMYLLATVVFYFMGAGIHRYLGGTVDWMLFSAGLVCVILLHCSSMLLNTFFDGQNPGRQHLKLFNKKDWSRDPQIENKSILSAGLTTLTSGCVLTFFLLVQKAFSPASFLVLGIAFVTAFFYAVPPFKLTSRGMGEVVQVILIANLYPAFAFLIQNGEMHRLVPMITFPLTPLLLATIISSGLPKYLQDMLDQKKSLLMVLQWKLGMDIHNLLVLSSYLIIGMAALLGLSWSLTWPFLLAMPLSMLSVYEVIRIKNGVKPRWSMLLLGSFGSIGCTVYLITFALWTG